MAVKCSRFLSGRSDTVCVAREIFLCTQHTYTHWDDKTIYYIAQNKNFSHAPLSTRKRLELFWADFELYLAVTAVLGRYIDLIWVEWKRIFKSIFEHNCCELADWNWLYQYAIHSHCSPENQSHRCHKQHVHNKMRSITKWHDCFSFTVVYLNRDTITTAVLNKSVHVRPAVYFRQSLSVANRYWKNTNAKTNTNKERLI